MQKSDLLKKKLEDLRYIAKMMEIKSITRYRKNELVDKILEKAKTYQEEAKAKEAESDEQIQDTAFIDAETDIVDDQERRAKADPANKPRDHRRRKENYRIRCSESGNGRSRIRREKRSRREKRTVYFRTRRKIVRFLVPARGARIGGFARQNETNHRRKNTSSAGRVLEYR